MADQNLFNGISTYTPGVRTAVNDSAMVPTSSPGGVNLVLVGQSVGGIPNQLYAFASPAAAAAVLISGELLTAVTKAFAPATSLGAPATVYALRVGSMTQGTIVFQDTAGIPALTLTTAQAGTPALSSKAFIEAGTSSGFNVSVGQSGGTTLTGSNIGQALFTAFYSGSGSNPTIAFSATQGITITNGTTSAVLSASTFTTVGAMIDALDAVAGWNAVAVPGVANIPWSQIDTAAAAAVPNGGITATANWYAIAAWINGATAGGIFTAAITGTGFAQPEPLGGYVFATGASAPVPLTADWANAFVALQSAPVQAIATLSASPAVQAAGDAHVQYMSGAGQAERRQFTGPAIGTSLAAVQALPVALNSDRSCLCWPGYYDYDVNGNLTLFAPYMTAAIVAAGFASMSPGQSMTNVAIAVQGLELQVNSPTDTDPLIASGVCVVRRDSDGFVVVRAISTWLQNNAFDRVEVSTGYAVDYVCRFVRAAQKAYLGTQGKTGSGVSPALLARLQSVTETALNACAKPAPTGPGALVGDANSPPWANLSLTANGDVISTTFQCSPAVPLNFITDAVSVVPYVGTTVTVSAGSSTSAIAASS